MPSDEQLRALTSHVRNTMRATEMLLSLSGPFTKLKEDMANSYAAGDDKYMRSPADMRDLLVRYKNHAARQPRQQPGGLAYSDVMRYVAYQPINKIDLLSEMNCENG